MSTFSASSFVQTPQPDAGEITSQVVSLLSISLLAALFGIKTSNVRFRSLSYSRLLVVTLYMLSWAFAVTSMVLASTNNGNFISCFLSEMACDVFYGGTKVIIYTWLIERVWVVSASGKSRWKTTSYKIHLGLMSPYIVIFVFALINHLADLEDEGTCYIGLRRVAALPLLIYDFLFNFYMTLLFIKPLLTLGKSVEKDKETSPRLIELAKRTLIASIVSLLVSFANILAVTILEGRERGVLCLACCTVDVTINVITIHWVTTNPTGKMGKDTTVINNSIRSSMAHDDENDHDIPYTGDIEDKFVPHHPFNSTHFSNDAGVIGLPRYTNHEDYYAESHASSIPDSQYSISRSR